MSSLKFRFGPAGLGSVKDAVSNLEYFSKLGLRACEIAFTYGIYIKAKKDAEEIGKKAKELDVKITIHAPYWINLNSKEKAKIEESKKRILDCCEIGEHLGAELVVFHAGFYGKQDKETCYQNIKKSITEMIEEIKRKGWKIKIAPETMGKINVFGDAEEILRLVNDTGCSCCIDFAHLHARSLGKDSYKTIYENFMGLEKMHCHFSGIVFGDKGERSHKLTPESEIKSLISALPKNKEITIINESPNPVEDAAKMLKISRSLNL